MMKSHENVRVELIFLFVKDQEKVQTAFWRSGLSLLAIKKY